MSRTIKSRLIPIFITLISILLSVFTPMISAEEEVSSEASLYLDTEDSFPYIYLSDNYINYEKSAVGKTNSGLRITGDYASSDGTSSAVLFFNSSSFGLDSFNNCTVSVDAMLDKQLPINDTNVKLYSDGAILESAPITSSEEWGHYSLDIGDCSNNIVGIYVQFKSPYTGAVCTIDNFTVIKPDGSIAKIEGIDDEVKSNNISPALKVVIILVLVLVLVGAVFLIIKEAFFKFY